MRVKAKIDENSRAVRFRRLDILFVDLKVDELMI